jgi:hypothetical protein
MEFMGWQAGDNPQMVFEQDYKSIGEPDILYYNRTIINCPISWIEQKKAAGVKTVVDMDDYWEVPPSNYYHDFWYKYRVNEAYMAHLRVADLVICTNFQLRDKILPYNKNVVVIPNAMPFGAEGYNADKWTPSDKTRFLWAGGISHLPDIQLLANQFDRIKNDGFIKDNAEFILAGYTPAKPWDQMKSIFNRTGNSWCLPSRSVDDYLTFFDDADVVLVPLVKNGFNAHKSVLKILEAATRKLPCIVSKVEPYYPELKDVPGIMWVEKGSDWLTYIRYCIKNPSFVRESGAALAEKITEMYDLTVWNKTRRQILEHLIKN